MQRRFLATLALAATPLVAACGDDAVDNPFRNFQIQDELASDVYVYDFPESTVEVQYFADIDQVVGVSRSDDGLIEVGFFGPPLDERTFSITAAALDSNGNGDFLDEDDIPLTRESSGSFSETGDQLDVDFEVDLGLGIGAFAFTGTGELDAVRDR